MNSGRSDLTGEGDQVHACVLCLGSNPVLGGAEPGWSQMTAKLMFSCQEVKKESKQAKRVQDSILL